MTANPLQELAEKLRNLCPGCRDGLVLSNGVHMFADGNRHEQHIDTSEISASLGTLLQAERAASLQIAAEHFPKTGESWNAIACSCGWECKQTQQPGVAPIGIAEWKDHIRSLAPASALSAVVQRETEKIVESWRKEEIVWREAHEDLKAHLKWALSDECDSSMAEFEAKKAAALEAIK